MKRIIITGALGHIGSQMIRQLPAAFPEAEIVMVDNMLTQRYCSLFNLPNHQRYHFYERDILQTDLSGIIDGADVVLHLAAITDAAGSFKMKDHVEKVNYGATAAVAKFCSQSGTPMIHLSSTSVYGTQKEVVDEECREDELRPQSPYAETKLKEERYLQGLGLSGNLRFVICRFGTICGVSPGIRFHTAVNKFCWQAVMGEPLTVWKTALHQKRPYLALADAVDAVIHIIKHNLFDCRVYNVLTENLTVAAIIESIEKHIPKLFVKYVDSEIMNQLSYEVSNLRFREQGFEFRGSISKCIDDTIGLLKNVQVKA